MLNTKKDRKNLYLKLVNMDLVTKMKNLMHNYHLRIEDGKFVPNNPSAATNAPWVYVKGLHDARCDIYHRIFFDELEHIHSYCRSCWKIVVRPRDLVELFDLYELQREMGVPCKCGTEHRKTTRSLYGGYFYTRSLEEGRERYAEVRKAVDEHLSKKTPVILKRACTEFEIGPGSKGPSDKWPDCTPREIEMERYVESHFPRVGYGNQHPDHLTAHVMVKWVHHAYQHGDDTFKEFTDGETLFPDYITYHDQ